MVRAGGPEDLFGIKMDDPQPQTAAFKEVCRSGLQTATASEAFQGDSKPLSECVARACLGHGQKRSAKGQQVLPLKRGF